jgi:hypothetical protein
VCIFFVSREVIYTNLYKRAIERYEYSTYHGLDVDIKVVNVKVHKLNVTAKVTLNWYNDGRKEVYPESSYPKNILKPILDELAKETCYECGESVAWGSGKYVNRIPSLDCVAERKEMGVANPTGEWLCDECDSHAQDGDESYFEKLKINNKPFMIIK